MADPIPVDDLIAELRSAGTLLTRAADEVERLRRGLRNVVANDSGGRGCSSYTGPPFCRDPRSGRTLLSGEGATSWCDSCIATDALESTERPLSAPETASEPSDAPDQCTCLLSNPEPSSADPRCPLHAPEGAQNATDDVEGWCQLGCGFCGHWDRGQFTKEQIADWLRVHRNPMISPNPHRLVTASTCPDPCGSD